MDPQAPSSRGEVGQDGRRIPRGKAEESIDMFTIIQGTDNIQVGLVVLGSTSDNTQPARGMS